MDQTPTPSFFSFKGRLARTPYAVRAIGLYSVPAMLNVLAANSGEPDLAVMTWLLMIVGAVALIPTSVQRLHDMGWKGYWLFANVLPPIALVLGLVMLFTKGQAGENMYGANPRGSAPKVPGPAAPPAGSRRPANHRPTAEPVRPAQPLRTPVRPSVQPLTSNRASARGATQAAIVTDTLVAEAVAPPAKQEVHVGPAPLPQAPRIGYDPRAVPESKVAYPVVITPGPGAFVQPYRIGKSGRPGYKEADFAENVRTHFGERFEVRDDCVLAVGAHTRPYEPDLVLYDPRTNLYIDVEIDEPYSGASRVPTHCAGDDDARDALFASRGWIVVRFPEILVHEHPDACCCLLAYVLHRLLPGYSPPTALRQISTVPRVQFWDALQAQKWERERYRESYLGISSFGVTSHRGPNAIEDLTPAEQAVIAATHSRGAAQGDGAAVPVPEATIVRGPGQDVGSLAKQHYHPRDANLTFDAAEHRYTVHGNPDTVSVTTLIDRAFPGFDAASVAEKVSRKPGSVYYGKSVEEIVLGWEENRDRAAQEGTALHEDIESYLNGASAGTSAQEFGYFRQFMTDNSDLTPYRTEWRIYDEHLMVAGTVDALFRRPDGSLLMVDWKRSKEIKRHNSYASGLGPLKHLPDANYHRYALQQNVYRQILRARYGVEVDEMMLLVLHPTHGRYQTHAIPIMEAETQALMQR